MVVLALAVSAVVAAGAGIERERPPAPSASRIAVVPEGTTPADLARVPGMGVGLMSAGIGPVPAAQTFIDVGQGARIAPTLYDDPLPLLSVAPGTRGGSPGFRRRSGSRCAGAPTARPPTSSRASSDRR